MKPQLISILIFVLALVGIVLILNADPFGKATQKELEMEVRYKVAKERAYQSFKKAERYRLEAQDLRKTVSQLQLQLKTNQATTNETVIAIPFLAPDSLGLFVAEQVNYLDSAWY